LNWKLRIDR